MSISKIKQLREERKKAVNAIKSKIKKLENDQMYAEDYKKKKIQEFKEELQKTRIHYDDQITELLLNAKNEALRNFHNAEFDSMSGEDAIKTLLKEIRHREMADVLVKQYINNHESLYEEAQKVVKSNLPHAPAYIKALKDLNVSGADTLEKEYRDQNLNSKQKMHKEELNELERVEKEYEIEKTEDYDPFKAALMTKTYFGE